MKSSNCFKKKLHTLCSTDVNRNNLKRIYFQDDCAYVTNGHSLLKQNLHLHDLMPDFINELNGHCITAGSFAKIFEYKNLRISGGHIVSSTDDYYIEVPLLTEMGFMDSIKNVLKETETDLAEKIKPPMFDYFKFQKVLNCMFGKSITFYQGERDSSAYWMVDAEHNNQTFGEVALLMPILYARNL